jgi:tRNA threonylcarbamoyladenosine biosynthesis protein TsaE
MSETSNFQFDSTSLADTDSLGQAIGAALQPGTVLGFDGTLGAGKTRLTQAIGIGLGIKPGNVVSPTFTIMVPHAGRLPLIHLDAYRIKSPEEVDELGLDEMVVDGAVLVVEWSDRIANLLPPIDLGVQIEHVDDDRRRFQLTASSEQGRALLAAVEQHFSG